MPPEVPQRRNNREDRRRPEPDTREFRDAKRRLKRAGKRLEELEKENANLRVRLAGISSGEGNYTGSEKAGVRPDRIVWILGSGRTGSSWLAFMLAEMEGYTRWNEPLVGYIFGHLLEERAVHRRNKKHFILSSTYEDVWLDSMRALIIDGANARFPSLTQEDGYLIIKEPHSARNATLIMKSLPESRMLFLVRDPRDMVASTLNWSRTRNRRGHTEREKRIVEAEENPDVFVRNCARNYLKDIEAAAQAFEHHEGHKTFVRYEDLRHDTTVTMQRLCRDLDLETIPEQLSYAIDKHSWENVPEEDKGEGKIRRKASPGGWEEDLTTSQSRTVESICAPIFKAYYPEESIRV